MNSRERVVKALNHQEPDRVPIDIGSTANNFTVGLFNKLTNYFNIKSNNIVVRPDESAPYYNDELYEKLGSDFRHVFVMPPSTLDMSLRTDGSMVSEWGLIKKPVNGMMQHVNAPLRDVTSVKQIQRYSWPDPDDEARYKGLRERAKHLYEENEYAIAARSVSHGFFELSWELRGMENFFVDMAIDEDMSNFILDKTLEIQMRIYENYLKEVGEYVHVVQTADDYGTQNGPIISPDMFCKYIKPRRKKLNDLIREYAPNAKIFHHTCGSVFDLIEDLIECGVDILNPVQPYAHDMDSVRLKKKFGSRLCFHGGIDEQRAFTESKEILDTEIRKRIKALAPGGGYIIGPTSNIQDDTSIENVLFYIKKALEYGKYPINL